MSNLTDREIEAIQCAADGHKAEYCADKMGISVKTYYAHILNAREKTKTKNVSHLVSASHRAKIITMVMIAALTGVSQKSMTFRPARNNGRIVRVSGTRLARRDTGCIRDED